MVILGIVVQAYLQDHFDGEDAGEDVVEVVEDVVAEGCFRDRVFSGERHAAGTDDDHDEQVKVAQIDDEMTEPTNTTTNSISQQLV